MVSTLPHGPKCGKLIEGYPLPRCTLPPGHPGICKTTMIPEELSGIAADMLRGYDDLETERVALHAERATLHVAIGSAMRQRRVIYASIWLHAAGLAGLIVVVIMGMSHAFAR